MFIYFAGPLFSQAERAFNLRLTMTLEEHGYTVFLPQRDGLGADPTGFQDMTEEEAGKVVVCTLGLIVILFCAAIFV